MQKEGTIDAWPSSARRSGGTRLACFGNVRALWVFGSRGPLAALLTLVLALLLATPAHAKRIALVVGNAAYTDKPLTNPVNDAELMQRTLQGLGFEVSLLRNASRRELLSGLRDFEAKAADAEVALFYFAGHGTQVAGNNYLIPLQAQIRAESDVPDEAVDAGSVLRRMENARAKVGLVVLDACRDNPYAGASRSSARGLGRMSVPTGSIVAYATAPGSTADDGKGRNGVYTEQLAKHLATPGLDLREVFDRTAVEVERLTGGKQKPREDIGLRGRLVLKPGAATQVASVVPEPVTPLVPVPSPGQVSGTSLEDLQREEAARKEWAQWQARMKADFDKTAAFSGGNDLLVKAWERFLNAWRQDNPLSQDDEGFRGQAMARIERLRGEMQAAAAPLPIPASSSASASARVGGISVVAPDIAENGAVVPVGIVFSKGLGPGQSVDIVFRNQIVATIKPLEGTLTEFQTRIRMTQTGEVSIRLGGQVLATKQVAVTLGANVPLHASFSGDPGRIRVSDKIVRALWSAKAVNDGRLILRGPGVQAEVQLTGLISENPFFSFQFDRNYSGEVCLDLTVGGVSRSECSGVK